MSNRGDMPASPVSLQLGEVWSETEDHASGMTIRERMAMAALNGLLSNPEWLRYEAAHNTTIIKDRAAMAAVSYADALLAELERTGGGHE